MRRAGVDAGRDDTMGAAARDWVLARIEHGDAPAWLYRFDRVQPYTPGVTFADHDPATVGAYHSVEMPYFLRTLDSLNMFGTTRGSEDEALRDAASGALVAFAKTGSPTTQAVDWPEFDNEAQEIVIFDTGPIETREIPYREGLDFFRQQRFGGWRCRSGHLFRSASACPRIPTSSDTESWPGALPRASVLARCPKISRSRKRSAVGAHRRHFAPSTRAARPLANPSARVSGR